MEGRINYYAERTPELPQTLKFVIGQLKKAHADPGLPEYAIANAFDGSRAGEPYETRGEAMAADLADGLVPNTVARFRQGVLALRQRPDLTKELFRRLPAVYGTILPGFGGRADMLSGFSWSLCTIAVSRITGRVLFLFGQGSTGAWLTSSIADFAGGGNSDGLHALPSSFRRG